MLEIFKIVKGLLEQRLADVFGQLEQLIEHYTPADGLSVQAATIKRIWESLQRDTFQIMMLGHFSSGKSTLLNALMGYLPLEEYIQDQELKEMVAENGLLPIADLPTTPVITLISYAELPRVLVQSTRTRTWHEESLEWYLREMYARATSAENEAVFADISQLHLELPVALCQVGITLVDVPGIENSLEHNQLVDEALEISDIAIVLIRSGQMATLAERKHLGKLSEYGMTTYFTVVNLFDKRRVDYDLKARAWERLVRDMVPEKNIPPYEGQDLARKHIYFVNALQAQKAKFSGQDQGLKSSGLLAFEEQLTSFLQDERFDVHVTRFIDETISLIERLLNDLKSIIGRARAQRDQLEDQQADDYYQAILARKASAWFGQAEIAACTQKIEQAHQDIQHLTELIRRLQAAEMSIRQIIADHLQGL